MNERDFFLTPGGGKTRDAIASVQAVWMGPGLENRVLLLLG
jgi:hypothetical protein